MCCCPGISDYLDPLLRFLYHISPSLVTVVLGSLIVQRFFISRTNHAKFIDDIVARICDLQADSLEYWNNDCAGAEKRERCTILEQKIKGSIRSLSADLAYCAERYGRPEEFAQSLAELADACSGGDFESKNRKPDNARYLFVVNAANRLRSQLLRKKM
jgi:hypothetical protein